MWDGRAHGLRYAGAIVTVCYDGAIPVRKLLVVPGGARHRESALRFLVWYATHTQEAAAWAGRTGYGVAPSGAMDLLEDGVRRLLATHPANAERMARFGVADLEDVEAIAFAWQAWQLGAHAT
jgi:putative spermidine/putrescine transport system substrate-binding protein